MYNMLYITNKKLKRKNNCQMQKLNLNNYYT